MAADSATAEALGFSRSGRRRFRFPCGHVEPEATVGDRLRRTDSAAWVRCHACNAIALMVRPKPVPPCPSVTVPVTRGADNRRHES